MAVTRVVFDCNLFLQAAGKGGNHAFGCLQLVEAGVVALYLSVECFREIEEVLRRPEIRALFPLLDDNRVDDFMEWIRLNSVVVDPCPPVFSFPRDPKDEPYINAAIAANASFLVSWDKDLIDLGSTDSADGHRLSSLHPSLVVLDPKQFLELVRNTLKGL